MCACVCSDASTAFHHHNAQAQASAALGPTHRMVMGWHVARQHGFLRSAPSAPLRQPPAGPFPGGLQDGSNRHSIHHSTKSGTSMLAAYITAQIRHQHTCCCSCRWRHHDPHITIKVTAPHGSPRKGGDAYGMMGAISHHWDHWRHRLVCCPLSK